MASIEKRGKSYRIVVSCGYDINNEQIKHNTTWKPEPGMTKKQIEKELNRQAVLFEEKCIKKPRPIKVGAFFYYSSYFVLSNSTAFAKGGGTHTPISPAFSVKLINSFTQKPIQTASFR